MNALTWDPSQYARFSAPRARPFHDLLDRVGAQEPGLVVDVGCGPGELTLDLARRWPRAQVRGFDSSPEMIGRAPAGRGVEFSVAPAEEFDATGVDVVVANAVLQWVPGHLDLLRRWAGQLRPGAWLAFQVPSNFDAPSHRLMRDLAGSPPWRHRLAGVLRGTESVAEPARYLDVLAGSGLLADVWQTEYQHVLTGTDPVLEWVRGTALRPVLHALDAASAAEFEREYAALLREAYPARDYGTPFAFRRTFAVGTVPS
ncbi:trans-aconitate 2-methyltransferase [Kineococcus sp. SYSU DK001]|uniref:trans-aconitate 2-methyltransferase n=1 Tax=Kineococcus sp. SYSU DK001 TaxID=3383122 RepID=UPI003D7CCF0C